MADEVRFITPRMLASHARTCKKDNCIRCTWHRCGDALRKRFVFKHSSHGSMPWLVLAMQWSKKCKTSLGVGCVVCYRRLTSLQQKRDGFTSAAVFANLSLQPHMHAAHVLLLMYKQIALCVIVRMHPFPLSFRLQVVTLMRSVPCNLAQGP